MAFQILNKLRDNKLWWVDVVFYFIISSLIATVLCYLIFSVKISIQKESIEDFEARLITVGTEEQKEMEKQIFLERKRINDYAPLIENHKIPSNVLAFLEKNTLPNIWYTRFSVGNKTADITLSGEAESVEVFSKQVSIFEQNEYLTKMTVLSSIPVEKGRISFNLVISLDSKIFNFVAKPEIEEEILIPIEDMEEVVPIVEPEVVPEA